MAHLQYLPGDPRLVDQLVYELKSKGIFDQFRKDCIADVDTRPAYQNLRQRVENSVSTFLARQCWQPDLNKNQLREKLRKHILDGNYLEQGVERIVDQVVNPKVASVFIPQVEDLVYNYLGITRKKTVPAPETSNGKVSKNDLLPTDLEAVSPGSVNDDKNEEMEILQPPGVDTKMEVDLEDQSKQELKEDNTNEMINKLKIDAQETQMSIISEPISIDSNGSMDKSCIPLPDEEINLENIPAPENSPPKAAKVKVELEKIQLPEEPNVSTDIPLPEETFKSDKDHYFKPVNSDDDDSSSDSSLRRNMSPLTPIRNFNNENSCDAQQAFENEFAENKSDKKETVEPNIFRFSIESKDDNSSEVKKVDKKDADQANLSYQFNNQVNINAFNTPMYDDSSNSNLLHIDYESDVNSKLNIDSKTFDNKISEADQNSNETKKDRKQEDRKSSHRSSHKDKDSHKHSSSKEKRSDSKQSSSRDSRSDKKSSKDDKGNSKSSHKDRSSDKSDKKDSKESSKHRSSHKSSSSHKDSKSHRSSSSNQKHSNSKHSDEKKSSSSHRDKEKNSRDDKNSKEKSSKDTKSSSSSYKSDKDRKNSSSSKSKHDDKGKKKDKKETDDHYSASGRGSHSRRSTDRDSNDGSSSSKGSHNPSSRKSSESKKESKSSTSKSDSTSTSGDSTSPSDKDHVINQMQQSKSGSIPQNKPIVRVDNHLEVPILSPPRLPFVPDVTLRKPKIAANLEEARKLMKMRKFLDEEQKRMNQEAALLLEFQANVRPSMSQVYSSIPGPELEFACVATTSSKIVIGESQTLSENQILQSTSMEVRNESISDILNAAEQVENKEETKNVEKQLVAIKQLEPGTVEGESEDEINESDKATVHIEKSIDTEEIIVEKTPLNDSNDKILNILSDVGDDAENKLCSNDTLKSKVIDNVENADTIVVIETRNEKPAAENINNNLAEPDDIEMKLSLLHEKKYSEYSVQVIVVAEEVSDAEDVMIETANDGKVQGILTEESALQYFGEHEKYKAELERDTFSKFFKAFTKKCTEKMYLINCDTYEENILKDVLLNFGMYEVVNYHKNGHLTRNKTSKTIVRNVNVSSEISLPVDSLSKESESSFVFSPVKSDCSFELSSDYDAKLEEMVSKTSRREIMEIILGNAADELTDDVEMPTIGYCSELNIASDTENTVKRKYCEIENTENNNRQVLTPNKIRKLSDSDQITSTTGESDETSNNNVTLNNTSVRSKYLGRARRVGLPRPRRSNITNSPSSDKSIENYEQNTPVAQTPNGKIKAPRNKVQRYDTSELYKPKLHYLSRRNNVS